MGTLYTIQPDDLEPIEFTHFDCWSDNETWQDIVRSWESNLGISLADDSIDATIMDLLRNGFDVYEGDEFIEIYYLQDE